MCQKINVKTSTIYRINRNKLSNQWTPSLIANEEIINPMMEKHSADHFNKVLSSDDMLVSSFDLEHHVSADFTQSKKEEEIQRLSK